MRNRRAIFSVLTSSCVALAFVFVACSDDPPSEFVDPKLDSGTPDRVNGFNTDTGTPSEGSAPVECKPSLPTTFAATFTPPVKKEVCSAADIKSYYEACLPYLTEQPCTDWLAAHADCAKCIEAPDAKGPVQIFESNGRPRYYSLFNNAGCIALVQGKSGDDSCAKAYDTAESCERAACDGCFAKPNAQFEDFNACRNLASTTSCKDREATNTAKCYDSKPNVNAPDGGAPQCFAKDKNEDPVEVYKRITSAFCLKP